MTSSLMLRRLEEAGFDAADASSRAVLLGRAIDGFVATNGVPPRWAWFVPGRIEVFGKHTDYAGGRSLVAAVPRGFAVVAGPRRDLVVSVHDARWHDRISVDLASDEPRPRGWGNYVAVVAQRFAMNFAGAALGTDITVASDLPRAAGLSSSSAFVVGLGLALARRADLGRRPEWRAALPSVLDLAGYLGAVENGLTFGDLAGTSGVGTHGGSEDHTAILASKAGRVGAFGFVPVRTLGEALMPAGWRFLVMTSGVHADKAGSVRGQYNRASLATRALADLWVARGGRPAPLGAILAEPGALAALEGGISALGHGGFSATDLRRRLRHFWSEDGRILEALGAFARADVQAVGALAEASQAEAESLLGNQVEETTNLAAAARLAGAAAASSFGAGFGGSVWALSDRDDLDVLAADWQAHYRARCPSARSVEWFAARPGPPAAEIDLSE